MLSEGRLPYGLYTFFFRYAGDIVINILFCLGILIYWRSVLLTNVLVAKVCLNCASKRTLALHGKR